MPATKSKREAKPRKSRDIVAAAKARGVEVLETLERTGVYSPECQVTVETYPGVSGRDYVDVEVFGEGLGRTEIANRADGSEGVSFECSREMLKTLWMCLRAAARAVDERHTPPSRPVE